MAKDDLSVKIDIGFDVNKNELGQARDAIAAIKAEIDSVNNTKLRLNPSGSVGGNALSLQPFEAMLKKAISGGQAPDFKKVQIGLFNKLDDTLAGYFSNMSNVFIDDLNKSTGGKGVASKSFIPAIEKINEAIDNINARVTDYAKAFNLDISKEVRFDLVSPEDIKKLGDLSKDFINIDTKTLEDIKQEFMDLSLQDISESGGDISDSIEVMGRVLSKLNINVKTDIDKMVEMLGKLEGNLELNDQDVKAAFDFKAIKDNTTLALSPSMFESLFRVIIQEAGEYIQNGNVFKNFKGNAALLKYEERDPKPMWGGKEVPQATPEQSARFKALFEEKAKVVGDETMVNAVASVLSEKMDKNIEKAWKSALKSVASSSDFKAAVSAGENIDFFAENDFMENLERYLQEDFVEKLNTLDLEEGLLAGTTATYAEQFGATRFAKRLEQFSLAGEANMLDPNEFRAKAVDMPLPPNLISVKTVQGWLKTMVQDNIADPITQAFENPAILGLKGLVNPKDSVAKTAITNLVKGYMNLFDEQWIAAKKQSAAMKGDLFELPQENFLKSEYQRQNLIPKKDPIEGELLKDIPEEIADAFQDADLEPFYDVIAGNLVEVITSTAEKFDPAKDGNLPVVEAEIYDDKKEMDDFLNDMINEDIASFISDQSEQLGEEFAKDFYSAMRGGEFEQFKGEFEGSLEEFEKQKAWKRTFGNTPMIEGGAPAQTSAFEQAKAILLQQKALADAQKKQFQVAIDTEFLNQKTFKGENITELSMMVKDLASEGKKFVEVFKFMQTPTDDQAFYKMTAGFPEGFARSSKDMYARGAQVGLTPEEIGKPGDAKGNYLLYRKKIEDAIKLIDLINQLGGTITGSNLSSETQALQKAVNNINASPFTSELGLKNLVAPEFKRTFDPTKQVSELIAKDASGRLAQIFDDREKAGGKSARLENLITKIGTIFEGFFNQYEDSFRLTDNKRSFIARGEQGPLPAHFASTDAKASLVVVDFIKELGTGAATLIVPVVKDANQKIMQQVDAVLNAGGSGGGKGPNTPLASGDKPEDGSSRSSAELQRAFLSQRAYEQLTRNFTQQEKLVLEGRMEVLRQNEEMLAISAGIMDREKRLAALQAETLEIRRGLTDNQATRANQAAASGAQGPMESPDSQRYYEQVKAVVALRGEILKLNETGEKLEKNEIELTVAQQRQGQVTEQLTQNLRKKLDVNIENTKAGESATKQIKSQMQEQVNAEKAVQKQTQSLMNTWVTARYALYDIGNFYQNTAQQLIRVARQIFNTTESYRRFETSFTSVERAMQLTQEGAVDLRDQFIRLSETIPVSFEEISRIATLGAQMGIAADGIVGFTDTVAKFASITGISADTVAQKFGKIAELADVDPTEFNNLGSAVAFAGVNAVATESEILTLAESIAAVSNQVGITAPEIIGLSTSLASVGIPAEQARGVFTRVFADIDRAAATGGKSLKALSEISGLSAKEISGSWGKEGAANEVFIALLKGLDASSNLTAAFDKLNIVETREINTLTRLAKNLDVVMQALDDAGLSFEDATFLGDSFDKTVDNLDSKITLFKSNLDSLLASLSEGFANMLKGPAEPVKIFGIELKGLLDTMSDLFKFAKGAKDSFFFTTTIPLTTAMIGLGAVAAGISAVLAKTTAQLYAFRVASINAANDPQTIAGFGRQIKSILGLGSALVEVRNDVSGIGTRGAIEPMNFTGLFGGVKDYKKELLETKNIYLALGDAARGGDAAIAAGATTRLELARLEADIVKDGIKAKLNQIAVQEQYLAQLQAERTVAVSSGTPQQVANIDALIAEQSQLLENMKTQKLYVTSYKGKIQVIDQDTVAQLENVVAAKLVTQSEKAQIVATGDNIAISKVATEVEKAEAAAHLQTKTAIDLQTQSAVTNTRTVGVWLSRLAGIASVALIAVPAVLSLVDAINKANTIDILEYGGGVESLREAIKKDTQAVKEGTTEAIAQARVEYNTYNKTIDEAAVAIQKFTGLSEDAEFVINKVTKATKEQTVSIAENTKEWIANALMKTLEEQDIDFTNIQESMASLGLDFDTLIKNMVDSANGVDINPLEEIENKLEDLNAKRDILLTEQAESGSVQNFAARLIALDSEIASTEELRKVVEALNVAFQTAFSKSATFSAIKDALGIGDASNAILDLVDRFKKVQESGKGMGKVMKDLKLAVIDVANVSGDNLKLINEQTTLAGMRNVIAGMLATAKATSKTTKEFINLNGQITYFKFISNQDEIDSLEEALASIDAIIAGLTVNLNGAGDAAESLADKISRLISEANSGVVDIMNFRESIRALGQSMAEGKSFSLNTDIGAGNTRAVLAVLEQIGTKAGNSTKKAINNMKVFKLVLQDMGAPKAAIKLINNAIKALGGVVTITAKQARKLRKEFAALFNTFETNLSEGAVEAVEEVEKKVRTLTDYVNDLRSVLQAAFDFRYGKTVALDAIANSWISIQESAKSAQDAIQSANAEINEAVANRAVLEYQLSVAERYNDEKRAAVIRAKLAKLDQEIIDKQEQLAEANEQANTTLTGNSKAAINNRAKIRDLVTQYNAYLIALANSGASSETLQSEAAKLEKEFLDQGIAMGFAQDELDDYTQAFKGDFTTVINGVPRDITVNVNTDPALRAIEEFVAKANEALSGINNPTLGENPTNEPTTPGVPGFNGSRPGPEKDGQYWGQLGPNGNWVWDGLKWIKVNDNPGVEGNIAGPENPGDFDGELSDNKKWIWKAKVGTGQWQKLAMGGMVFGPGGPTGDKIPAMLSSGEFVVRAGAVKAYGPDFMNALNQQRVSFAPTTGMSTQGGGGSSVVYLSPEDRALLRAAVDRPIALYTENTKIAQSANAGNMILAQRGSN